MQFFPPKYFRYRTAYPESGTRIQLGNSYQFDSPPDSPDQRIFTLMLQGMTYFVDASDALDRLYEPSRNLALLEDFYNTHKRATPFILEHPVYGQVVCKFNRPLNIPEGISGGSGLVDIIEVELIEVPNAL